MAAGALRRDDASERDLIATYLDEIGRVALLTKDDEARLAQAIESGREAQAELDGGAVGARATKLRRAVRDGERARDQFVEANLRDAKGSNPIPFEPRDTMKFKQGHGQGYAFAIFRRC